MKTAEDIDFSLVHELIVRDGFFVGYRVAVVNKIKQEFEVNTQEAAKIVNVLEGMGVCFPVRKRRKLRRGR